MNTPYTKCELNIVQLVYVYIVVDYFYTCAVLLVKLEKSNFQKDDCIKYVLLV